ncbi:unnamed protein product [Spirodela intermedia]|uniref:PHD-type domain-containing protein n=1 Tax=Spirodela intermedia TaxID=51605 RepID=A0A7I8JMZ1_SPIIN|nr:unnamed protein product [Spirodela intermedia]CAA6671537.1 unnamed protein product [Spirodela intermedia]
MRSSRGRALSSPVTGRKRGKRGGTVSRARKRQKRLDAICDPPPTPAVGSSTHHATRGESPAETNDAALLRRSTRVRKAPVLLEFSPSPSREKRPKSGKDRGHANSGGRSRRLRDKRNDASALALEVKKEIAPLEDADKPGTSQGLSDREEAADYCSTRASRVGKGQSSVSAACKRKLSFTKSRERYGVDDHSLRPGEDVAENLGSFAPESSRKGAWRRKRRGRKLEERNQIPRVLSGNEEKRCPDNALREQEMSDFPLNDNEENREKTILEEENRTAAQEDSLVDGRKVVGETVLSGGEDVNTCEEGLPHDESKSAGRGDVTEGGIVNHEKSPAEDENQFALEEVIPKAEGKIFSRESVPGDARVAGEKSLSEGENKITLGEALLIDGRVFLEKAMPRARSVIEALEPLSGCGSKIPSNKDLPEEKDESSTENASPEEEGRIATNEASPAGETKVSTNVVGIECGSQPDLVPGDHIGQEDEVKHINENGGRFSQLGTEKAAHIPSRQGNGVIDNYADIQIGGCETRVLESHNVLKPRNSTRPSDVASLDCPRVREGRRCGLCGGGTDGKPPKKLVLVSAESDNEQYNGSSSSEEPTYDVWDGFGDEPEWLGRLLGPIRDRFGIARVWVHQQCAVWSPEVYFAGLGRLKSVRAALCRGRALKCSRCGRPGATIGCRVDRCPKTYHLPCARAENGIFDHRKFLIACSDHRHLFQPQGNHYLQRIKKMKTKKMRLDLKKLSNEAWRKDLEAEEKWLENCGEDEEFLKREGKRLHRDLLRIAPVYIGGPCSESDKSFQGWESVAGLKDVIRCMKEVVILPLLYPELFSSLGLTPPRGVLLHGYPGTGKTLVVRALIGECSRGDKRIAYFARKGADCLGKYVGDAERQLRLLFQVAEKSQPSIIFFDEIDGLAPSRSKRQDQTHNSVVSTLLSLLDGLKSRGSVVVIGATNRPDAVDPALRRPGRFDREIYFPLPSVKDRSAILSLQTKNWPRPLSGSLLSWIAKQTAGYAGADLQALCTQAAMIALKRNCPLHEILVSAEKGSGSSKQPSLPSFSVVERDWLSALACAPPPCSRREAGMAANDVPLCYLLINFYFDERIWIPPPLFKASKSVKDVILSALQQMRKPITSWKSHLPCLIQKSDVAQEIERHLSYFGLLSSTSTLVPFCILENENDDKLDKFDFQRLKIHGSSIHSFSMSNISVGLGKPSGFRVLITGTRRSGQQHLIACLLHQFLGHIEIQKVNLSTISQEGRGDIIRGITQILLKCLNAGWCVVYMPRLDLWAVDEVDQQDTEESTYQKTGKAFSREAPGNTANRSSLAWDSFIEQMDSMSGSSSLIVLATCEMKSHDIPSRVKDFFTTVMVKSANTASSEHTIPRFSVELDGSLNHNLVIKSSIARISCDFLQQYVQLIHRRSHESSVDGNPMFCTIGKLPKKGKVQSFVMEKQQRESALEFGLMIATLGYQILQYPQLAELCWATSKLKEGPCADVSGPWKVWPFNSCIIHPNDSVDKAASPSISRNVKNKEISGVVRGLMAVGLLAYRGSYASVREVSSQVRIVLELLVGLISEKIQNGKDRYRYLRILSQVAYLEDMVNSWVYTFLSTRDNTRKDPESPGQNGALMNATNSAVPGIEAPNIMSSSTDLLSPGRDTSIALPRPEETGRTETSAPSSLPRNRLEVPGTADCQPVVEGNSISNAHNMDQAVSIDSGSRHPSELCNSVEAINPLNSECSGNGKILATSETICIYDCCPDCLQSIHVSVQEIVTRCWEASGHPPTVDDVHDIVTLCSLNLVAAVRNHFLSLDGTKSGEQAEACTGQQPMEGTKFFPRECSRHSSNRGASPSEGNFPNDSRLRPALKFLFRDGTLLASNPPEGAALHCSFGKLCVHSVIEMVSSIKEPLV